jgi:Uma2 family endonuclease
MATKQQLTGLKYADIVDLPEERRELLDGELIVPPSPAFRHQWVVGELHYRLRLWLEDAPGGVYFAPLDVFLSDSNVLQPDLLFVSGDRLAQIEKNFVRSAPSLVVEVSSPSTRRLDLGRKREIYERFAVQEYWFVDLDHDQVEVYRLENDRFAAPVVLTRDDVLESTILPGFSLSVDELLGPAEDDAS